MVIKIFMFSVIVLVVVILFVWFMEGYYVDRYNNKFTRYWRDHVVCEFDEDDFWYDIFDLVVVNILGGMNISFNNFPHLRND